MHGQYTRALYRRCKDALVKKASALGGEWTAERASRALWTEGHLALLAEAAKPATVDKKRKR